MIGKVTHTADFLSLIRLGMGHNVILSQKCINWDAIEALAEEQGLLAIVLDGIEKLAGDQRPSQEQLLNWIGTVLQEYEYRYDAYTKAIANLAGFYNSHGFKMMVLKGYACAMNWSTPAHRPCGDIDIWLFGHQAEADKTLAGDRGINIDTSEHHHTVFYWCDFMVENHYDFLNVHHHKSNITLETILKELGQDDSHYVELKDEKVYLPSPNLHALFLLRHMMSHFASTGIQIRQLMDWGFFVEKQRKEVDWTWLEEQLEKFGMKRLYQVFNAICIEDLGFDVSLFPHVRFDSKLKNRVLNDILSPEFSEKTPRNIIMRIPFKIRRWRANAWKHELCFSESMWSAFWSGVKSHLMKPSSI